MATERLGAEQLVNIEFVACKLSLSPSGVRKLVARRVIPVLKLSNRCVRFRWSEVEAAMSCCRQKEIILKEQWPEGQETRELPPGVALGWAMARCLNGSGDAEFIRAASAGCVWTLRNGRNEGLSKRLAVRLRATSTQ
jgi:hypothetical protein